MSADRAPEVLPLPEPARSVFRRTRAILDDHVTPRTPDRSGWKLGGGTVLAARWGHRGSRDIDLLVPPRTETRFLQPDAAPELHRRLADLGATRIEFNRFSRIVFERSRIEILAADPEPRIGHRPAIVDDAPAVVLATSQILTGKFANRSLNPPVRDLYDLAVARTRAPRALMIAVNALSADDIRWRLVSWRMERDKFAEEGRAELDDVPQRYEDIRADPADYAGRAVLAAVYRRLRIRTQDGAAVVETTAGLGPQTRTFTRREDLEDLFEQEGIHAVLAAAGTDPDRIRAQTDTAVRSRKRAVVLELDLDSAAWGPLAPAGGTDRR